MKWTQPLPEKPTWHAETSFQSKNISDPITEMTPVQKSYAISLTACG